MSFLSLVFVLLPNYGQRLIFSKLLLHKLSGDDQEKLFFMANVIKIGQLVRSVSILV